MQPEDERPQDGSALNLDELLPVVQKELKEIAHRLLRREGPNQTTQVSDLVQETVLRLLQANHNHWQREHLLAAASKVMRNVLVDRARRRKSKKRWGDLLRVPADEILFVSIDPFEQMVAFDLALESLTSKHPRKAQVVEMRLFGGMSVEEISYALGVGENTVIRDYKFALAFLHRDLYNVEGEYGK